jgi:glutamate/tyrosine decarboxylase-like PLP-dependent enzyme
MSAYPYADRYPVLRGLPSEGRDRNAIVAELRQIATDEDKAWESGKCSGTMYCGDHDHYAFMNEVFGMFGHMNILQRDMCPSATRFEGEVIAMTLDLMHGSAAARSTRRRTSSASRCATRRWTPRPRRSTSAPSPR